MGESEIFDQKMFDELNQRYLEAREAVMKRFRGILSISTGMKKHSRENPQNHGFAYETERLSNIIREEDHAFSKIDSDYRNIRFNILENVEKFKNGRYRVTREELTNEINRTFKQMDEHITELQEFSKKEIFDELELMYRNQQVWSYAWHW